MLNYLYNKFFTTLPIKDTYGKYIVNKLINYKSTIDDCLSIVIKYFIVLKFPSNFSLIEYMLILDGFICSILFIKHFIIFKMTIKTILINQQDKYKEELLNKYNNLYKLVFIDRYLLYLFLVILNYNKSKYLLLITLPFIQNYILSFSLFNYLLNIYIENRKVFIKYNISKLSINFIQKLHPQIERIINYNIFIIYKLLTIKFVFNIIKNFLFILLLSILRNYNSCYPYYKCIKLAYYYNVGYLYNVMPLNDAIYLVNIIIKEKRWKEIEKVEVINGFFTIIANKFNLFNKDKNNIIYNLNIILLQFISLWSIISLLKFFNVLSNLFTFIFLVGTYTYLLRFNLKNIITSIIIYVLIYININDFVITCYIILNKIVYYSLTEFVFFIINSSNIKKVIKMYELPSKQAIISKVKEEYIII